MALGRPSKRDCHEIDYDAFRSLVRHFLTDDFVDVGGGLIVNPEAGEVFTLTRDEKKKLVAIAAEENSGKVPFVQRRLRGRYTGNRPGSNGMPLTRAPTAFL